MGVRSVQINVPPYVIGFAAPFKATIFTQRKIDQETSIEYVQQQLLFFITHRGNRHRDGVSSSHLGGLP